MVARSHWAKGGAGVRATQTSAAQLLTTKPVVKHESNFRKIWILQIRVLLLEVGLSLDTRSAPAHLQWQRELKWVRTNPRKVQAPDCRNLGRLRFWKNFCRKTNFVKKTIPCVCSEAGTTWPNLSILQPIWFENLPSVCIQLFASLNVTGWEQKHALCMVLSTAAKTRY